MLPFKLLPRNDDNHKKNFTAFNKYINSGEYTKILPQFEKLYFQIEVKEYVTLNRKNLVKIYSKYKDNGGKLSLNINEEVLDSSLSKLFLDIFETQQVYTQIKSIPTTPTTPIPKSIITPIKNQLKTPENIMQNVLSKKEERINPFTIKRNNTLNLLNSVEKNDSTNYTNIFTSLLKMDIPSRFITFTEDGICKIINDSSLNNSIYFNKTLYKHCPFHSGNAKEKDFISVRKENKIYGYITQTGNVYDCCRSFLSNVTISDNLVSALLLQSDAFDSSLKSIEIEINNILAMILEKDKLNVKIKSLSDNIIKNNGKLVEDFKNKQILNDIIIMIEDFFRININSELTVNIIKSIEEKTYIYNGTKLLNKFSNYFNLYNSFFVDLKKKISKSFSKEFFNYIYSYNNEPITFNNYYLIIENIKSEIIEFNEYIQQLNNDIEYIENNLGFFNINELMQKVLLKKVNQGNIFKDERYGSLIGFNESDRITEDEMIKRGTLSLNIKTSKMIKDYILKFYPQYDKLIDQMQLIYNNDIISEKEYYNKKNPNIVLSNYTLDASDDINNFILKVQNDASKIIKYLSKKYQSFNQEKINIKNILISYNIDNILIEESFKGDVNAKNKIITSLYNIYDKYTKMLYNVEIKIDDKNRFLNRYTNDSISTNDQFNTWKSNVLSEIESNNLYKINEKKIIEYYLSIYLSKSNENIEKLNGIYDSLVNSLNDIKKLSDSIDIMNKNLLEYNKKKNNYEKEISKIFSSIRGTFINRLPTVSVLTNLFNTVKIPFSSNIQDTSSIITDLNKKKNIILDKISGIEIPEIKILLSIFKQTNNFINIRNDMLIIYFDNFTDEDRIHNFNKIIKNVSKILKNINVENYYQESNYKYPLINDEVSFLFENKEIDLENQKESYITTLLSMIPKDKKKIAKDILYTNYFTSIMLNNIRDVILSNVRKDIVFTEIPNLDIGNQYFIDYFSDKQFISKKISEITSKNILSYQDIMFQLMKMIEKSLTIINKGPGMTYFYNCLVSFLKLLENAFQQFMFDDYNFDIDINDNFIEQYEIFLSLFNRKIDDDFFITKEFNNFSSLLTGRLLSSDFIEITNEISNFKSPFNKSDILTDSFVISTFKILEMVSTERKITLDIIFKIMKIYNLNFVDNEFFIEDLNDIQEQLNEINITKERYDYLNSVLKYNKIRFLEIFKIMCFGINDLIKNIDMFTDENKSDDGRIVSYNNYFKYNNDYIFYTDKLYLKEVMNYFFQLFNEQIIEDNNSYTRSIINSITTFFDLFNTAMINIESIEDNLKV